MSREGDWKNEKGKRLPVSWHWKLMFEPRDIWIGLFWDYQAECGQTVWCFRTLHLYICIVPCLVLKIWQEPIGGDYDD
jgi:hypothetical protein